MSDPKATPQPQIAGSPFNILEKNRMVWLNKDVNDDNMADLGAKILLLSAEDPEKDIYLIINSPGGSITAGLMLYDIINLVPNDVVTVAVGMAASMGQFLLTVGAPGKRFITPHSSVLLHQPHGGFGGTASDIVSQAKFIQRLKDELAGLTAERTGKTIAQIHLDGDRDRWFTAQEAVEYGFADRIITSFSEILETNAQKGNQK